MKGTALLLQRFALALAATLVGHDVLAAPAAPATVVASAPASVSATKASLPARLAQAPRTFTVDLPVWMDGRPIGELGVTLRGTELLAVEAASMLNLAGRHLATRFVESLTSHAVEERISVEALRTAGLEVRYDPTRLIVTLEPRVEQRAVSVVSLAPGRPVDLSRLEAAPFSAYVNMRAVGEHVTGGVPGNHVPLTLAFDGATRAGGARGVAFEWSAFHERRGGTGRSTRGDLRLTHDRPEQAIRIALGDVHFLTAEQQGNVPLLGLSVERRYADMQPWRTVTATGQRSFVLSRPSQVSVFLNGMFLRALQLPPGRYDLSDFSTADGANDVRIEVEDSAGQREVIEFTLFREATLLSPGQSEFSANLGLRRANDADTRIRYEDDRPAWSGFVRYGLTEGLTVGANYQGERDLNVLGVEGVTATALGNFGGGLNLSRHTRIGDGATASLRWAYNIGDEASRRLRRLDTSLIYTSRNYLPLGVDVPSNRYLWQLQTRYTTPLADGMLASFSARHARGRAPLAENENRLSATLTGRIGRITASAGVERILGTDKDTRAFITLTLPLGSQQRVLSSWQEQDNRSRVEWAYYPRQQVGGFSGVLGAETSDIGTSATADVGYRANRFIAHGRHDIARAGLSNADSVQRTRLQIESALAYAGGHFALGRPVGDAFVIVSRHDSLKGSPVLVNPFEGVGMATADGFGPALLPGLTSYRQYDLYWDVPELPVGYDLGDTQRQYLPPYRAGMHYQVGSAASITAMGVALRADGQPLALVAGELRARGEPDAAPAKVFTNRSGRFVAQSLAPGAYTVRFATTPPLELDFVIGEDATSYVDLGVRMLKEK